MKRSNNKGKNSLAKSPKTPRRKKQRGPGCSREPDNNENPKNTKDAPRKEKQPTRVKNKGEEEGKRRKRKRNQVTLITNYCYIISYFSYRGLSQNVCDKSQ